MKTDDVKKLYDDYVLGTYSHLPVCLVRGKGSYVWDIEGKKYLDFFPGWAVSGLGHCPPAVTAAVKHQANKMLHISNNFLNCKQAQLAQKIAEHSFSSKTFFCNSGAEAIEAAIKFGRRYGNQYGKYEIITMQKSFHGRTLAAVTATGQVKYHDGFDPLPEGFKYVEFNVLESLQAAITPQTAVILLEPVQGEGGVHVATKEYLQAVRKICDEQNILLVFDEVQTGMGRTGEMFAFKHFDVEPDLMTLAKSLGGGVPIGALVVNNKVENCLVPGTHASTFGGNPLVTAAGLAVFKTIEKERLLENARVMGAYLREKLKALQAKHAFMTDIRGLGLMCAVQCAGDAAEVVKKAMEKGLLINCTQGSVLRVMPALNVTKKLIDTAMEILDQSMEGIV